MCSERFVPFLGLPVVRYWSYDGKFLQLLSDLVILLSVIIITDFQKDYITKEWCIVNHPPRGGLGIGGQKQILYLKDCLFSRNVQNSPVVLEFPLSHYSMCFRCEESKEKTAVTYANQRNSFDFSVVLWGLGTLANRKVIQLPYNPCSTRHTSIFLLVSQEVGHPFFFFFSNAEKSTFSS